MENCKNYLTIIAYCDGVDPDDLENAISMIKMEFGNIIDDFDFILCDPRDGCSALSQCRSLNINQEKYRQKNHDVYQNAYWRIYETGDCFLEILRQAMQKQYQKVFLIGSRQVVDFVKEEQEVFGGKFDAIEEVRLPYAYQLKFALQSIMEQSGLINYEVNSQHKTQESAMQFFNSIIAF